MQSNVAWSGTMIEWAESIGWQFVGNCACAETKRMYTHPIITGWMLWILPNQTRMEIRKVWGNPNDSKVKGIGGPVNYKDVYMYWIGNDKL